jgi:pimeloyl-ACP methyl ester carboxylesterase
MEKKEIKGNDKGTIVFIHGSSSSSKVFDDILNDKTIGQTKIALDLPGHGERAFDNDADEDFSMLSNIKKMTALLNNINDDILLVGNSIGGHLAIEVSHNINRLKGLVILGTPPVKKPINFEEAFLPVPALQTFITEDPTGEEIENACREAVFSNVHTSKVVELFKQANPKVRGAVAIDLTQGKLGDEETMFTTLNTKKFIIKGMQDPSVNPTYLDEVKSNCIGDCEILEIDECGHYPSLEKPVEFCNAIKKIAVKVFN